MDWGTVLGAISVIIALLSIPLTIFSPIFTPKINDWYVKRSVAKTEKSIMKFGKGIGNDPIIQGLPGPAFRV